MMKKAYHILHMIVLNHGTFNNEITHFQPPNDCNKIRLIIIILDFKKTPSAFNYLPKTEGYLFVFYFLESAIKYKTAHAHASGF